MGRSKKHRVRWLSVTFICVVLLIACGLVMPLQSERYDRAIYSGDFRSVKDALASESNPNRLVAPPTVENRLRKFFGYGLVGRQHPAVASVREGHLEIAVLLAQNGVDINGHDGTGFRALTVAASAGDVKGSEVLLNLGANPNLRWKDGTPIHKEATDEVRQMFRKRGIRLIP